MNTQGKTRLKVWGALIIVFALGCATGASLDAIYRLRDGPVEPQPQAGASDRVISSMRDADAYFDTLHRELSLSDDQSAGMRAILDRTREQYKGICGEVRPRYDALRERARTEMRVLLSPEQQQRFDQIITQEDCRCPELKK
jgi:hypothetical protein